MRVAGDLGSAAEWRTGAEAGVEIIRGENQTPSSLLADQARLFLRTSRFGMAQAYDLETRSKLFEISGLPGKDVQLALSQDRRTLAATTSGEVLLLLPASERGKVSATLHRVSGHTGRITGLAFVEKDRFILTSSVDHTVRRLDLQASVESPYLEVPHRLIGQAGVSPVFSPDLRHVALLNANRYWEPSFGLDETLIWDLHDRKEVARIPSQVIAWRDSSRVISWEHTGELRVWDMTVPAAPKELASFLLNSNHFHRIDSKLVEDGNWVVSIDQHSRVQAWDGRFDRVAHPPEDLQADAIFASISTPFVVIASAKGSFLWDLRRQQLIPLMSQSAADARFSPDGETLAVTDWERGVELFDGRSGESLGALGGQLGAVVALEFTGDGRQLVTGSEDRSLMIWNLATRRVVYHEQLPFLIAWISVSPDSKWLVTGHVPEVQEGGYRIWKIEMNPRPVSRSLPAPETSIWKRYESLSRDLVRWEHLPVALYEEDGIMIFSGSAVVDRNNTSGFGKGGVPPLVAIYTGHYTGKPLQNQQIAYSNDRGRSWTKYHGNPVLDLGEKDFRDPKVFWHESTRRWVVVVSWPVQRKVRFYSSPNLKEWSHLSDFGPAGSTQGIWECPDLFPLPVEGRSRGSKWVLIVNVGSGAPAGGSGCQYFIGEFNGREFVSETKDALWADYGRDFYAAVSWSDVPRRDGRRLWLGWMSNWEYANDVPTTPWRSAMTIPRSLTLRHEEGQWMLLQRPVKELQRWRGLSRKQTLGPLEGNVSLSRIEPVMQSGFELDAVLRPSADAVFHLTFHTGPNEKTVIRFDLGQQRMALDRARSGNVAFHPKFSGVFEGPVTVRDGELKLTLFVDSSSIEVFANDGETVLTHLILPAGTQRSVEVGVERGMIHRSRYQAWEILSTWRK